MDKLALLKLILSDTEVSKSEATKSETFFEVGKIYAFRTVTMIYTGRIKKMNGQEILIEEAAWIPETERWTQFVTNCDVKECEPYPRDVILSRGALLDATEIVKTLTVQK